MLPCQLHQYIGATDMVAPCQLHQYIGATDIVAPLVLVQTYGQNRHNCLHSEYNGAAMLAAPIIAYTEMFTMCDVAKCR